MQQQRQAETTTRHAEGKDVLAELLNRKVVYKPFMGDDPIDLSVKMILDHLAKPTRNGNTCPPEQANRFMKLCEARGLNPWEGDAFLVGYDTNGGKDCEFNIITSHQAFLKRAEVHPEFNGMESGVSLKPKGGGPVVDSPGDYFDFDTHDLVGGWARVHFKNRTIPIYRRVRLATYNTGYSRWKSDPAGMICKVAEADALRSSFPTKLGGCYLREEIDSSHRDIKTERPSIEMPRGTDEPVPPAEETTPLEEHVDEMLDPAIDRDAIADEVCRKMYDATTLKELRDAYAQLPQNFTLPKDGPTSRLAITKDERKLQLLKDEIDMLATNLGMSGDDFKAFAKLHKATNFETLTIKQAETLVAALTQQLNEREGGNT